MKNILFIEPLIPWPLSTGGHQAIYNCIKAVENSFNIFITYEIFLEERIEDTATPELRKRFPNAKIYPFIHHYSNPHPLKVFLWKCFQAIKDFILIKKKSADSDYGQKMLDHFKPANQDYIMFLNALIIKNHIDIVQAEMISCLSIGASLSANIKRIFVHHELRFVCHELDMMWRPISRYEKECYNKAKELEIDLLNKYDAIITLSQIDKAKLQEAGVKTSIYDSFAIVNTEPSNNLHSNNYHDLTFIGPQYHNPNYLGVMWFLENCWNRLLAIDSDYRFTIIGQWETRTIDTLSQKYKNLFFSGYVKDIKSSIADTIAIVPLTIGSGIRMKILEAAAIGVPFVSTTVGVEGLPFKSGVDCFIADDPMSFIDCIIELKDRSKRQTFTENSRNIVIKNYSAKSLSSRLTNIYELIG